MKKLHLVILSAVMASLWCITACNTLEGVGKDIKKSGEAIERAAK